MGIKRRSGSITIDLAELLEPKEGEESPFEDFRDMLREAGATLRIRRVPGRDVDRWQREMTAARVEMKKRDTEYQKDTGVKEAQDPESEVIFIEAHKKIFTECYEELQGFEDVSDAESAWEALYDFMPFLAVLLGGEIMRRQRPDRPES